MDRFNRNYFTTIKPPGESLNNALYKLTSMLASPAQDYISGKEVGGNALMDAMKGKRTTDWTDVVKTRYPKLNPTVQKVYGEGLNMLLDPTNLVPMGAIGRIKNVFHGSPHAFDAFDIAKLGSGEGAQAYGHGLYFAGKKDVAEFYKDALSSSGNHYKYQDKVYVRNRKDPDYEVLNYVSKHGKKDAIEFFNTMAKFEENATKRSIYQKQLDFVKNIDEKTIERYQNPGHLYDVDLLPDEDDFLMWDKPLSEQSDKVRKALLSSVDEQKIRSVYQSRGVDKATIDHIISETKASKASKDTTGKELVEGLGKGKEASEHLHSIGIKGIKYSDGTSRNIEVTQNDETKKWFVSGIAKAFDTKALAEKAAEKERNYNYVIFNDKDAIINNRSSGQGKPSK